MTGFWHLTYRVIRIGLDVDLEGWRPPAGYLDKKGDPVEDRIYNRTDFDRNLVVEDRREIVAQKITEFLNGTGRFSKSTGCRPGGVGWRSPWRGGHRDRSC